MTKTALDALDDRDKFLLALGRFIDTFVNAEANARELVGSIAGIDDETRRALLSGARIDGCIDFIRRIHRAKQRPLDPALDRALIQLVVINKARNTLLHYGAKRKPMPAKMHRPPDAPYLLSASNWHVALTPDDVQRLPISTEILDQLRSDTLRIVRVTRIFIGDGPDEYQRRELAAYAGEPWLYKPPQPEKKNPRSPSNDRARQRPQKSSRA